jgi:autotransporter-associated beta strand protein
MRVLRCAIWRAVAALTYLTIALAAVPRLRAQDKTYFITGINMGVTGSITTDGALGNLSASDILGWSLTATTWQNSGSSESVFPSAGLVATQSQLYLNFPTALGSGSTLQFATYPSVAFSTAYGYNSQDYAQITYAEDVYYAANDFFGTTYSYTPGFGTVPNNFVVAAVGWTGTAGGSWNNASNWSTGASPNGVGLAAVVGAGTATPVNITLDTPQTLGSLTLMNTAGNAAGYTLSAGGAGSLTMSNSGLAAQINVLSGSHAIAANVILPGSLAIAADLGSTLNISGAISGPGSLSESGSGELILAGSNGFTGGATISGLVQLGNDGALGNGSVYVSGTLDVHGYNASAGSLGGNGTIDDLSGSGSLTIGAGNLSTTFPGTIRNTAGELAIVKTGSGTAVFSGTNSYSGGTSVSGGVLQIGSSSALGDAAAPLALTAGTLDLHGYNLSLGALSGNGTVNNLASAAAGLTVGAGNASATFSGTLQNSAGQLSLTKTGSGTLALDGTSSYGGGTTVASGLLQVGNAAALGTGGLSVTGGTLDLHGFNLSLGSLTGGGVIDNLGGGSASLTVNNGASSNIFSGAINNSSGVVSLSVVGSGTLTLTGSNGYSGTTAVSAGALKLDFSQTGAPVANIVNYAADNSSLALSAGTLLLQGNTGAANSQCFNGLTIQPGSSFVVLSGAASSSLALSVGAISNAVGGAVDFTLPGGAQTAGNGIATTSGTTNGILGGFATVGGANWATVAGGLVVPYSGYTTLGGPNQNISGNAAANVLVDDTSTGNVGLATSNTTINSLLVSDANARTVNVGTGNTLRLGALGGILLPPGAGGLTIGVLGSAGTLTAGGADNTAGELYLANFSSNPLAIDSVVADNGSGAVALVKTGSGTLLLVGSDTFSGGTTLDAGVLQLGSSAALGAGTAALNVAGGTLDLHGNNLALGQVSQASGSVIGNLAGNGAYTLTVGNGNASSTLAGTIQSTTGSLSLAKVGAGSLTMTGNVSLTGSANFAGAVYQPAATLSAARGTYVDGGVYCLSGSGRLGGSGLYVGQSTTASFTQTSGTVASSSLSLGNNVGSSGSYTFAGGSLTPSDEYVGVSGSGSYLQSGGANTTTSLYLGANANSSGSGTLTGGALSGSWEYIGESGSGVLTQSGGVNSGSFFYLGQYANSSGTYNLNGGLLSMDYEYLDNAGAGTFNQSGGTNSEIFLTVQLGNNSGNYILSGGRLIASTVNVGYSGSGSFTQSGGTNSSASVYVGNNSSSGAYNLGGGQLTPTSVYVGYSGPGTFSLGNSGQLTANNLYVGYSSSGSLSQTGGASSAGTLTLGYNVGACGAYNLSGSGLMSAAVINVGWSGSGSVTQFAGTASTTNNLSLGCNAGGAGSYTLNGGQLSAPYENVGLSGTGTFTQSSGTNSIINGLNLGWYAGSSGTYNISGSGSLFAASEFVGVSGNGTFTQSGGVNSLSTSGVLSLGYTSSANGSYNLSGSGLLYAPTEFIGESGMGTFNQSAGTNNVGYLYVGVFTGGSYNLSGSGVLSAANECIALSGSGTFIQSGGTNAATSSFFLFGGGEYDLTGGALLVSGMQGTGGTFNLGSGTLVAGAGFSTSQAMTLSGSGGNGNINTAGYAVTFSGALSGPGGLNKVGPGTLVLSGSNDYQGGTDVMAGTLEITDADALPDASLTIAPGGTFIFDPSQAVAAPITSSVAAPSNPVPEPCTLALLTVAICGAALYETRLRRAKRRAPSVCLPCENTRTCAVLAKREDRIARVRKIEREEMP